MNLASLLRWIRRILELLARGTAGGSVTERTRARYGWMEHYRAVLTEWTRWEDTVSSSVEFIRVHGFFQDCDVELAAHLCARPTSMRHAHVEAELITFACHESASARHGERLVGSSEVEESVFGKLKTLEGDQCSSGFTRYVLSIGAVVGDWTTTRLNEDSPFSLTNRKQISPDQCPNATPTLLLPRDCPYAVRVRRTLLP